jgi:hypothetical protein
MKQKQLVWLSAAALAALLVLTGCPTPDDNKPEPPPPVGEEVYDVNLAPEATVTAPGTSQWDPDPVNNAKNINDGRNGSMGRPYLSYDDTNWPEDIVLTWTEYKVFNTVVYYSQNAKNQGVTDIEIAVSVDGTTWKKVFEKSELVYNTSADDTYEQQVFQFEKQTAKALRFRVKEANYIWNGYAINELEVFLEHGQRPPAAQMPAIIMGSTTGRISQGGTLTVTATASVSDEGTLSWQWYQNTSANKTGGSAITGASGTGDTSNFSVPTDTVGEFHYYVVFTNSGPAGASPTSATGSVLTVTVTQSNSGLQYEVDLAQYATATTTANNTESTPLNNLITANKKYDGWNCNDISFPVDIVLTWPEAQTFNTVTSAVRFARNKGIKSAEIWVSEDGTTGWTKVSEAADITYPSSEEAVYETKVFTFDRQTAKGLKVVVKDAPHDWGMWCINQLTVTLEYEYGVDMAQYAVATTTATDTRNSPIANLITANKKYDGWNCYDGFPVEIVLTWPEVQTFNTVTSAVRFAQNKGIKSAKILVSEDGVTDWTEVSELTGITYETSEDSTYEDKVFTFDRQTAKGLKMVVADAVRDWSMWCINQLTVTMEQAAGE